MREQPYTPTTDEVRAKFADGYSIYDYRDIAEGWFDRWLDGVRAAARREGQAEALRDAIEEVEESGVDAYATNGVVTWLNARAARIENGEEQ